MINENLSILIFTNIEHIRGNLQRHCIHTNESGVDIRKWRDRNDRFSLVVYWSAEIADPI